ncbi:MAG: RHS repeat-associated core domain-containing protein [Terriglobales bacterium]|jgi:RHS repeat-associated protein
MKLHFWFAGMFIILGAGLASGQVATGTPPFGSLGGGPFDTVNLGNLNVHFAIPVLNKAGRGTPFSYNLAYDSSIWQPVTSSGTTSWTNVTDTNWGWTTSMPLGGHVSFKASSSASRCGKAPDWGLERTWNFGNWAYYDGFGTRHPFSGSSSVWSGCSNGSSGFAATASDSSGYTISVTGSTVNSLTAANGAIINPATGATTLQDANGNQVTSTTSSGTTTYTDTLGTTVLTVAGVAPNPVTFQYTAPSGALATYTMNYQQYTVQTGFGITGISEYGPLSNALVSGIQLPDGSSYRFTYEKTPSACTPLSGTYSSNCVTGRIASVILPTGGEVTYVYSGGNNGIENDGSTAGLTRTLSPGGEWQYARSLSGSTWTTTITDPNQNQTVINFAKDGNTTAPTYNFYETQRQVKQLINGTQTLLATSTHCYNANYANCSTASVSSPITQTDAYSQLPNNSTRLSEVQYNGSFTGSGLVSDDKEYNYGVTLGAAPSSTYLVRETAISYASLSNNIYNKPSSIKVYDWTSGSAVTLASSTYAYDQTTPTATSGTPQQIAITGSRGNLTTATTSTSSTATLSSTYTYYDTGNPYVVTDVNSAQTTYVYGSGSCGNSFATTINEPLSLSRSLTWNCTGGIATQATDENGNNVATNYTDPDFWRPANVYDQESNETTISYIGETAVEAALQNFNGGNSVSDSRTTVDGFGRTIFIQRLQGPGATNYDTAEVDYNNVGQPYRSTMPYSALASPSSSNTTAPATTTNYDALGRVLTITDADGGTVSYTYTNNDVLQTVSGTQTFQKQLEYDGLGRLTSVCEISSTLPLVGTCGQSSAQTGLWTKYTYDALGHLLTVRQDAQAAAGSQQTRSFVYDMLGRLASETNPETNNIAYTYGYDTDSTCGTSNSDLVKRGDAVGNVTCYAYDKMHRLTAATYPSGTYSSSTPAKCYVYDAATVNSVAMTNAKGRLAEALTGTGTSCPIATKITDLGLSYSARGELSDVYESTPHSSGYYHVSASYWPHGLLNQLTSNLSGLPTISYGGSGGTSGLDGEGRILQVTASSGQSPVTGVTYTNSGTTEPIGSLTKVTLGSVDSDSFQYDVNTGRPTQYQFNVGTTQSVTGNLGWNSNGTLASLNITDQLNSSNSQSCAYAYDDLARLGGANCGNSIWSQTFSYDAFGNITKNVPNGSTGISFQSVYSDSTNWLSSIGSLTPAYDNNGNLKYDTVHNFTWDADGKMLNVDSTTVQLTYDALGRAVEQNRGGSYTQIVYAPYGAKLALMNGTTLVKAFVSLPGGPTAVYAAGTTGPVFYRHADWLGSSRLASTQSRTKYFDVSYAPFGENYNNSGTTDYNFTGQDQDTVTGYDDFLYREYSPVQGRWMSPDPAGMAAVDSTNPQTWNRYAYVVNSPLNMTDPLGLCYRCRSGGDAGGGEAGGGDGDYIVDGFEGEDWILGIGGDPGMPITASVWDAPPGSDWVSPGQGDPELIAQGALVNQVTDELWVPGVGSFMYFPPGTTFDMPPGGSSGVFIEGNAANNANSNGKKTNLVNATCSNPYPITNDLAVINGTYQNPPPDYTTVQSFFPLGGSCTRIAPNVQCYSLKGSGCTITYCAASYVPFVPGQFPGTWVPKPNAPTTQIKEQVCSNVIPIP